MSTGLAGRGLPGGVLRRDVAVPGRPGEQAPLQREPKQVFRRAGRRHADAGALGHEDVGEHPPGDGILFRLSVARAVERVLVVLAGERVQRVPAVPVQVGLLGAGHDERVYPAAVDERAHRVHPGAAVPAHGGEEAQPHAELV